MPKFIPEHYKRVYDHIKVFKETGDNKHLLAFYTHPNYGKVYHDKPKQKWLLKYEKLKQVVNLEDIQSILDVGCATRKIAEQAFKNCHYKGFDINSRFLPDYIGDAHELSSVVNAKFDLIILFDLLEHVFDPVKVLKEASKISNKIAVMTPQMYHLECINFPKNLRYSDDRHIHVGGAKFWIKIFNKAKLKILHEEGFYYVPSIAFNSKNQTLRKIDNFFDNYVTRTIDTHILSKVSSLPIIKRLGQESLFILTPENQ